MSFPINPLPDYTTQSATAYKNALDSSAANYARKAGGLSAEAQSTPNMTVRINAGSYFSNSTSILTEIAAQNITITTAPTSPNNRIDRIVFNTTTLVLQLITGTPSVSPTAPAVPSNAIPIARIQVNAETTSITNNQVNDERPAFWQGGGDGLVITRTAYTASTTWTKDANLLYAEIEVQGGGGGGGACTNNSTGSSGGAGGTSSFGSHVSATGGSGGTRRTASTGSLFSVAAGNGSNGDVNRRGEEGSYGLISTSLDGIETVDGGSSILGDGGRIKPNGINLGGAAAIGNGAGGTGAYASSFGSAVSGSSGGYARKLIDQATLGSTETITIGAAGTNGTAGSGSTAVAGGSGSAGVIIVTEYRRA
jgi:hypothetical protein